MCAPSCGPAQTPGRPTDAASRSRFVTGASRERIAQPGPQGAGVRRSGQAFPARRRLRSPHSARQVALSGGGRPRRPPPFPPGIEGLPVRLRRPPPSPPTARAAGDPRSVGWATSGPERQGIATSSKPGAPSCGFRKCWRGFSRTSGGVWVGCEQVSWVEDSFVEGARESAGSEVLPGSEGAIDQVGARRRRARRCWTEVKKAWRPLEVGWVWAVVS